jgi:hypothetical protein
MAKFESTFRLVCRWAILELTSTKGAYGLCESSDVTHPKTLKGFRRAGRGFYSDSVSLACSSVRFASSWVRRTIAEVFTEPDCPAISLI